MNPEEIRQQRIAFEQQQLLSQTLRDQNQVGFADLLRSHNIIKIDIPSNMNLNWGLGVLENILLSPEFNVTSLSLVYAALTTEQVEIMSKILISPDCKVKNLNFYGSNLNKENVAVIADALKNTHCKVENICLGNNNIDDESAQYILEALRADGCKIKVLDLRHSNMTARMVKDIIQAGTISKKVEKFDFRCRYDNIVLTKNELKECFDAANATLNRTYEVWLPIDMLNNQDKQEVIEYADRKGNYQDGAQKAVLPLYSASRDKQKYSNAAIRKLPIELLNQLSEMIGARPKISIKAPF